MQRLPPLGIIVVVPVAIYGLAWLSGRPLWLDPEGFLIAYGMGIALFVMHQLSQRR
jgi:hypothetical protein